MNEMTTREIAYMSVRDVIMKYESNDIKMEAILGAQAALVQLYKAGGWSLETGQETITRLWGELGDHKDSP